MKIKIRAAKKTDLPACQKISKTKELKQPDGNFMPLEYISKYLNRNHFLVALDKNKIVGFIFGEKIIDLGSLVWAVAISPEYRGHNIGTLLLQEYEKRMKKIKREWIILYGSKDKKTLNFYKKNKYICRNTYFKEFIKEFN